MGRAAAEEGEGRGKRHEMEPRSEKGEERRR